jgi:hypothetical protein
MDRHQWGFMKWELSGTLEVDIKYITAGIMHEGRQRGESYRNVISSSRIQSAEC